MVWHIIRFVLFAGLAWTDFSFAGGPGGNADPFNIPEDKRGPFRAILNWTEPNPGAFAGGRRPGSSTDGHRCDQITAVPRHLTFITRYNHYRKYTHAYGIPIVSTSAVPDSALRRACYVVRFLLADRKIIRKYMYRYYGRVGIMGAREGATSIPEHRHLGRWWDTRSRGLGGTLHIPISTGAEENLLCYSQDRYRVEDIFLHEFSHGIQEISIKGGGIPGYMSRLYAAYNNAKRRGLWRGTYAINTVQEYFGEGVQSFFDVNAYSARPNGVHNHVNTRAKLRTYDPTLFRLLKEVFPCMNIYHKRCNKARPGSFRMNCDGDGTPVTRRPLTRATKPKPKPKPRPTTQPITIMPPIPTEKPEPVCEDTNQYCTRGWKKYCLVQKYRKAMKRMCYKTCCCDMSDSNEHCPVWAKAGYCTTNPGYMHRFCNKSCGCK